MISLALGPEGLDRVEINHSCTNQIRTSDGPPHQQPCSGRQRGIRPVLPTAYAVIVQFYKILVSSQVPDSMNALAQHKANRNKALAGIMK